MPKPKSKKLPFIDKKNAVTFQLIHRSQQDPLAADDDAPQRLLQPLGGAEEVAKRKEEERKWGVFFEDEYNYLKHLKDRKVVEHDWEAADRFIVSCSQPAQPNNAAKPKIQLPSTVFASHEEEEVGLLNKAAPTGLDLSLDPDVVAAMDEDFDYEDPDNVLEDDFIQMAMEGLGEQGDEDDEDDEGDDDFDSDFGGGPSDDEDDDEVPSLKSWTEEETGTKFTSYSMSSSVMKRNAGLTLLDDQFEKFMDQYGEQEEGALEGEEIEGAIGEEGERMQQLIAQNREEKVRERQKLDKVKEIARLAVREEEDEGIETVMVDEPRGEKWDCESILSTYSTLYNHPKLISEPRKADKIRIDPKTGIPKDVLGKGLTAAALKRLDIETGVDIEDDLATVRSHISELSVRNKHETMDEKKARKAAVKDFRRARREERKANTEAFKEEKRKQEKNVINKLKNVQGRKLV